MGGARGSNPRRRNGVCPYPGRLAAVQAPARSASSRIWLQPRPRSPPYASRGGGRVTNPGNPTPTFTPAEIALCRRLAAEGASDVQMAREFCRSLTWMRACRHAAGVPAPLPERRPSLFNEIVNGVVVPTRTGITYDDLRRLPPCPPDASFEARAQASTAFLIACLRAGHKHGAGEYQTEPA